MQRVLIFVFILAACCNLQAQDTLYLMSGKMKTKIHVMQMDSVKITFTPARRYKVNNQGLVKTKTQERHNVLEIHYEDGTRDIVYIQDSLDYIITFEQARSYVDGCHDAFEHSHNRIVGPVCYFVTVASFYVLPPIMVTAVPCVYSAVIAIFTPDFPADRIDDSQVNKYYILGYQDTRKIKKVKSSMFFGVGALVTGFGLYFLNH